MTDTPDYIELHCHSCFSLLDGASTPEALAKRAAALGMPALALTDHDGLYGAMAFSRAAEQVGIRPIFGAELTLVEGFHLTLLVQNGIGWANLCRLITLAQHQAPKGQAMLPADALDSHTEGLIALSGCKQGEVSSALLRGDWRSARQAAGYFKELFGADRFWIELQHHLLPEDDGLIYKLNVLARQLGVGAVATNNVHYATRREQPLQDVLVSIRHSRSLDDSAALRRPNSEYYLKSMRELYPLFKDYPSALTNTRIIAEQCQFLPAYGLQDLPIFPTPQDIAPADHLRKLCEFALSSRLPDISTQALAVLDHELSVIQRSDLTNYFLIVWDIVRFAREKGIRCQGRGSAANSLVAYLLGISPVNPLVHHLVFERFLSDERRKVPDIDLDFQADRREEVIQYVYERYGRDHAAMACTFVTFREKMARREVGKALGLPPEVIDAQARSAHARHPGPIQISPSLNSAMQSQYDALCGQILGLPRHLGIHSGGMILTGSPLNTRLPAEPATMPDRTVVQWDKDALESAGLIKIDLLGLRMLSAIAESTTILATQHGSAPDLDGLQQDDPDVYSMIQTADTVGVFQVESRAQAQVLPRLRPQRFEDLIVSISLIRPGPVQGNMVHPYLRRRTGVEPVRYAHPLLEPALEETLGVILFQEQVLKVARDLAGFTAGQGELLRRALGSKTALAQIERFHGAFVQGAAEKGVANRVADWVFDQLRAFGGYSFPKSHAAAFAVLVYQSAWLKYYHPHAFYVALLNNQPMGFWSPAVIVNDARRHGISVLPVDIQLSGASCSVEGDAIRLGLNYVKGLSEQHITALLAARAELPFSNLADLCKRVKIPFKLLENLISVGALDVFGESRRQLLWALGELHGVRASLDLAHQLYAPDLPALSSGESVQAEFSILGLSTGPHPMQSYRADLLARGILGSKALQICADGVVANVAGQLVMHQSPPTAKGYHFLTLEDEDGMMNIILRPDVYASYRDVLRQTSILRVEGQVQHEDAVVNVLAKRILPLL